MIKIDEKKEKQQLQIDIHIKTRKAFYIYPDIDNPEELFDLDDICESDFFIACYEDKNEDKYTIHIWKGSTIDVDEEETQNYIEAVKANFFKDVSSDKINIIEEIPLDETDELMNLV